MNTYANMNAPPSEGRRQVAASAVGQPFALTALPVIGRTRGAAIPVGVALAFATDDSEISGEDRFALHLVNADGEVLTRLGPFSEDDVVAIWRDCAAKTGLPRMIVREDGALAAVSKQIGLVMLGDTRERRRHGALTGRRPRFLTKRKTASLPARPLVHRGEREIGGAALS